MLCVYFKRYYTYTLTIIALMCIENRFKVTIFPASCIISGNTCSETPFNSCVNTYIYE